MKTLFLLYPRFTHKDKRNSNGFEIQCLRVCSFDVYKPLGQLKSVSKYGV